MSFEVTGTSNENKEVKIEENKEENEEERKKNKEERESSGLKGIEGRIKTKHPLVTKKMKNEEEQ